MKLEINIEKDKELRNYIRECINGQVKAITRETFTEIVNDEMHKKVEALKPEYVQNYVKRNIAEITKKAIIDILWRNFSVDRWSTEYINPAVRERIEDLVKNVDLKTLIKNEAKNRLAKAILD